MSSQSGRAPGSSCSDGEPPLGDLLDEALLDGALEPGIGGADAVRAQDLDDRDVDQQVVALEPVLDQPLRPLLPAGGEEEVDVVVEHAAVADHDRIPRLGDQLLGDLGMEDPRLRRDRRLLVDRQRAPPRHLVDHLDRPRPAA